MLAAVIAHENVHATRFMPALVAVEAAITASIEAVTVPHTESMTEAEAIKQLEADGAYQTAVKNAYQTWLLKCSALVKGDHDGGGPTDLAEEKVTKALMATICAHAKKQSGLPARYATCDLRRGRSMGSAFRFFERLRE